MDANRRDFIKVASVAGVGAVVAPTLIDKLFGGVISNGGGADALAGVTWGKAPCRFCGTGCGVEAAVEDGRILAVRGDPQSPVNKGLLCTKGYGLAQVLYGEDRLTRPQLRKDGKLVDISWDEALDLIASRWKKLIADHGRDSVALFGSGQWTIPEGYAALKWIKGGIRSNNIEPNARLCMASAVVGFLTTYGIDEPAGSYDDLDVADSFFLWGSNMAEMHPMLYNRILQRRQADKDVRIFSLQTYEHMTDDTADETYIFRPHTDLYLANAIAHILLRDDKVDKGFVDRHTRFMLTSFGSNGGGTSDAPIDFEGYRRFLADYAPEKVAGHIGMSVAKIERLASEYGNPDRKCTSLWTMGMNQHTRGVWINNLVHNLHLLTGKVAKPGNSPFSLTGQPSACGTCREVGTFTHRLPSDRVVKNPEHRKQMENLWGLEPGTIPSPEDSPLTHAKAMWDKFAAGKIKSIWVDTTNPYQSMPDLHRFVDQAGQRDDLFLIVSDMYPTATTQAADLILPSACWVEKEGFFGNSERRTQHFAKMVDPPGEARPDCWQYVQVARRMGYENLFPEAWDEHLERHLFEDYRRTTLGTHHDLATYEQLVASRGLRWPVVDGKETVWRFNAEHDPFVPKDAPDGIEFYGKPDKRAIIWARPYEPPAESPDDEYPFWLCTGRVLEHWHTGTMTRRVPHLHRAVPEAHCYMHPKDAQKIGARNGTRVRLVSRRGTLELSLSADKRIRCPEGYVYVPFFDEDLLINEVTLGAIDPMSKQPDYKKCAIKVELAS